MHKSYTPRKRIYREDLTFAEWHRQFLPYLYPRTGIGHRLCLADRDWTEYCAWCREPLAILEEVVDRGQNLNEKSVSVTINLARRAYAEAYLIAPKIDRPIEVQARINELQNEVAALERAYPIISFKIKQLVPVHGDLYRLMPQEAAEFFLLIHRRHHQYCAEAARYELPVNDTALERALYKQKIMPFVQSPLFMTNGQCR